MTKRVSLWAQVPDVRFVCLQSDWRVYSSYSLVKMKVELICWPTRISEHESRIRCFKVIKRSHPQVTDRVSTSRGRSRSMADKCIVWVGFMDTVPVIGSVKEGVDWALALYEENPVVVKENIKKIKTDMFFSPDLREIEQIKLEELECEAPEEPELVKVGNIYIFIFWFSSSQGVSSTVPSHGVRCCSHLTPCGAQEALTIYRISIKRDKNTGSNWSMMRTASEMWRSPTQPPNTLTLFSLFRDGRRLKHQKVELQDQDQLQH